MSKSPQKKSAAKPIARKTSPKAPAVVSGKVSAKVSKKPLKKVAKTIPPPRNLSHWTKDIVDTIGAGTYLVQKGRFVFVSSIFEQLTGYAAKELIGKNLLDFVYPDDRQLVKKNALGRLKKKNTETYEYRFIRKNGDAMWILETDSSIMHQGKEAALGSIMDITRYKQTEESVELKEERYSTILKDMAENYYEIDLRGNFTFVNDALIRQIGYPKKELIGMNYRHYCDTETAETLQKMYARVFKTGKSFSGVEARFIVPDGSERFTEISGALIRNHQGKPIGFRGLLRDVTERKRMEIALRQSDERFKSLFDHSMDGIFIHDFNGKFIDLNKAALDKLGYDRREILSLSFASLIDEKQAEKAVQIADILLRTGVQEHPTEFRLRKKDGSTIDIETLSALIYREGKPYAIIGISRDLTERRKMEEELRKSEERYRTILEDIDQCYFELDLRGRFTFVNDTQCRDLGYPREALIGMDYRQYTEEATIQKTREIFADIYQTGQPARFEGVYINKNGTTYFSEVYASLMRDSEGNPAGFRGLSRNINERKWAEESLLQSEAKYLSIIESIDEAYFETDLTGVMTFANDKTCRDLGYSRNELLRMSNRQIQDEENARKSYAAFNQVYQTGQPVKDFQYEAICKDGGKAVFEMSISLMRDANGTPIGFRGLSRDITERKRMEDALRASEERARNLIATIPDPYVERDLQGKAVYVNDAYIALTGYSARELHNSGFSYRQYTDARNATIISDTYDTVIKTGLTMKNVELEIITKSGEKRQVNLSATLVRDNQGNPTGVQSIVRDITEKKKAEELIRQSEQSLREYSETLELRVRERTAELEKAKFAAEAASRTKSDFMANISHEFQTPLNAVIGFTRVLQDRMFGDLNEKQEEFLRYIADAGASLSKIITEILDVTHASSKSVKLNISSVSIADMLSKATKLLAPQMEEKHQVLTVDVPLDADVSIEADEQKIQQVLFHVLSNAVKYNIDGGSVHIGVIKTSHEITGREGISIAVADTGKGIKEEDIPKLFQTFSTLESPYTRTGKGIGMGLSLAKQLLELHSGGISVKSEYGSGSCFTIFLPLTQKQKGSTE